jgi:glycyl-tRNA synthetase alpha chain
LTAFLQGVESVYDITWTPGFSYRTVRHADELQSSVYNFEMADIGALWKLFEIHEAEAQRMIDLFAEYPERKRFPVLSAYEQVLKCSNLFNLLDARGAISVTERVAVIGRVRKIAVGVAKLWMAQQYGEPEGGLAPGATGEEVAA